MKTKGKLAHNIFNGINIKNFGQSDVKEEKCFFPFKFVVQVSFSQLQVSGVECNYPQNFYILGLALCRVNPNKIV